MVKDLSSWCEPACEMTPWGERTLNLTKPADDLALKRAHTNTDNKGCVSEEENLEEERLRLACGS